MGFIIAMFKTIFLGALVALLVESHAVDSEVLNNIDSSCENYESFKLKGGIEYVSDACSIFEGHLSLSVVGIYSSQRISDPSHFAAQLTSHSGLSPPV